MSFSTRLSGKVIGLVVGIVFWWGGGSGLLSTEGPYAKGSALSYASEKAVVWAVYDGDTIGVRYADGRREKVRLIGIDTPELDAADPDTAFMAFICKRAVFVHLYREHVELEYDWELRDKYGRLLAYVRTEDFGLFNEFLLERGLAVVFRKYPFKYRQVFRNAEQRARENGLGLWREGSWPVIFSAEAKQYIGQVVSVRFRCDRIKEDRRYLFLESDSGGFTAVIPQSKRKKFPAALFSEGRRLTATGYLEEYYGKPQIMIEFLLQLSAQELDTEEGSRILLSPGGLGIIRP